MSTAFTTIDEDTVWSDFNLIDEIIDALNERRSLVGLSAFSKPTVDTDSVLDGAWWNTLLAAVEATSAYYVNWDLATDGQFEDVATIPTFTLSTLADAVGHDLWRRAQAWAPPAAPTWLTAGTVQNGDIYGPWNLQDLHDAISALTWTVITNTSHEYDRLSGSSGNQSSAAAAIAAAVTDFNNDSWASYTPGVAGYQAYATLTYFSGTGNWQCSTSRVRSRAELTVPTTFPCEIDVYVYPQQYYSGMRWEDIDGYGFLEELWHYTETLNTATPPVAVRGPTAWLGDISTAPTGELGSTEDAYGVREYQLAGVCKWEFTTANDL